MVQSEINDRLVHQVKNVLKMEKKKKSDWAICVNLTLIDIQYIYLLSWDDIFLDILHESLKLNLQYNNDDI